MARMKVHPEFAAQRLQQLEFLMRSLIDECMLLVVNCEAIHEQRARKGWFEPIVVALSTNHGLDRDSWTLHDSVREAVEWVENRPSADELVSTREEAACRQLSQK